MSYNNIAGYIDHTLLKPTATVDEIVKLCVEAESYKFASVCIPPRYVDLARHVLASSLVAVGTVVGFPLGYSIRQVKVAELCEAIVDGAIEADVVMNIADFKSKRYQYVIDELTELSQIAHDGDALLKVIVETAYLSSSEIKHACDIVAESGADYVKTSTGFADIKLTNWQLAIDVANLSAHINAKKYGLKIKAAGGIKDFITAKTMLERGANRLGTSNSIEIMAERNV